MDPQVIKTLSPEHWRKLPDNMQEAVRLFQASKVWWPKEGPELPSAISAGKDNPGTPPGRYAAWCRVMLAKRKVTPAMARSMLIGLAGCGEQGRRDSRGTQEKDFKEMKQTNQLPFIPSWMRDSGFNHYQMTILMHIASRGACFESRHAIAANYGMGINTFYRELKRLISHGWVQETMNGHRKCLQVSTEGTAMNNPTQKRGNILQLENVKRFSNQCQEDSLNSDRQCHQIEKGSNQLSNQRSSSELEHSSPPDHTPTATSPENWATANAIFQRLIDQLSPDGHKKVSNTPQDRVSLESSLMTSEESETPSETESERIAELKARFESGETFAICREVGLSKRGARPPRPEKPKLTVHTHL